MHISIIQLSFISYVAIRAIRIFHNQDFFILVNPDNRIGAVGFTTMIAPALYPITLIKIDERTGEHIRDRNGVCIRAKPGEASKITLSINLCKFSRPVLNEVCMCRKGKELFT